VFHLIVNACDAMRELPAEDRRLTVATTRTPEGALQLSIADQGTCIAEHHLTQVFHPLATCCDRRSGLGLAMCRSIVKEHGGRVWAVNNPDGGATFHVVLPAEEAQELEARAATPS
jgi:C4-dicarboxylate-specific signal transduction histidine kinase